MVAVWVAQVFSDPDGGAVVLTPDVAKRCFLKDRVVRPRLRLAGRALQADDFALDGEVISQQI
jgi:hypothetical protein